MFQLLKNTMEISLSKKMQKMYCFNQELQKHTLFPFTGLDPDSAWTHPFVSSRTEFAVFIENPFLLPVYLLESDLKLAEL